MKLTLAAPIVALALLAGLPQGGSTRFDGKSSDQNMRIDAGRSEDLARRNVAVPPQLPE